MRSEEGDQPVHPTWCTINGGDGGTEYLGLTKREYFAAAALPGLIAEPSVLSVGHSVKLAVETADALIEELEKTNE